MRIEGRIVVADLRHHRLRDGGRAVDQRLGQVGGILISREARALPALPQRVHRAVGCDTALVHVGLDGELPRRRYQLLGEDVVAVDAVELVAVADPFKEGVEGLAEEVDLLARLVQRPAEVAVVLDEEAQHRRAADDGRHLAQLGARDLHRAEVFRRLALALSPMAGCAAAISADLPTDALGGLSMDAKPADLDEDGDLDMTLRVPPAGNVRGVIDAVQEACGVNAVRIHADTRVVSTAEFHDIHGSEEPHLNLCGIPLDPANYRAAPVRSQPYMGKVPAKTRLALLEELRRELDARDMQLQVRCIIGNDNERDSFSAVRMQEIDGQAGPRPCWNNPHFRGFLRGVAEDLFRTSPVRVVAKNSGSIRMTRA